MIIPIPLTKDVQKEIGLSSAPVHISTGGFKVVYRIKNANQQDEALKAIYIPHAHNEEEKLFRKQLLARAKREVHALGELKSSHLVKLGSVPIELHTITGNDYLVYSEEFLLGDPLAKSLGQTAKTSYADLYQIFLTLIQLIGELSAKGYLHRDIKPDNIMDTTKSEGRFIVLDLGIAYKMHGTELTKGNSPPGTLRYMAPELLQPNYKDLMDFRCDLYAAGLTVYVLATGKHPFAPQSEHDYATVYRIFNTTPDTLESLRSDLPVKFCRIIDRCIKKKPALRYARLELVEKELNEVAP